MTDHLRRVAAASGALLGLVSAAGSAQAVQRVSLRPADAAHPAEFSNLSVAPIRELRDGRVLVGETGNESRLVVLDFRTGASRAVGRRGHGPGEYDVVASLFPLGGDSTLAVAGLTRWLVLDGDRIVSTTKPDDPAVRRSPLLIGADRFGSVLVRLRDSVPLDDSVAIALVSRRSGAATPIATLATRGEPGYPPPPSARSGGGATYFRGAWKSSEQALLLPDGWVAVARLNPYRVDWRTPDGRWIRGAPLPVSVVKVNDAEKRAYMARLAARTGDPVKRPDTYAKWPRTIPPFVPTERLVATPDGKLLVPRTFTVDHPEMRYDLIDRSGRLEQRIVMKANERIVGSGAKAVYVAVTDDDGIQRLERHPWP